MFFSMAGSSGSKFGKGITFTNGTLAQAIIKAKAQKKLIFIDISAVWCPPCQMLKLKTFPNKKVGDFFNANFISLSFDGERGAGLKLARDYQITAYPTLIILDSEGKAIIGTMGYMDADDLIAFGKAAIEKSK